MDFSFPYGYGGFILKSDTTKIRVDKNFVSSQDQNQSSSNWTNNFLCCHVTIQ